MSQVRKYLATLLALSLPLAATAQTASAPAAEQKPAEKKPAVTIYGTLNVNLHTSRWSGATADIDDLKFRESVSIDSSNIGFRGSVDLTEGLAATFQCETNANVDGLNNLGLCNRNSRVGLTFANVGTLWYGNWDTPFKAAAYGTKADDPFGNTDVFGYQSIMGSPGFNYRSGGWKTATDTAIAGFDIRASNSVGFHTAKFSGFSAKVQYSVREFADAQAEIEPQLLSAVVNYDQGPLSVFASVDYHADGFGLVAINRNGGTFGATTANAADVDSTDFAWRVGAGYEIASKAGTTTVMGAFEQLILKQDDAAAGALEEYKRWAFQVGLRHRVGNHELRARYSFADEGDCSVAGGGACSTDKYGAQMYTAGYAYHLSKSVQTYAYYTRIVNDDAAQYTFTLGGAPAVGGQTPAGADPEAFGIGIRYAF